MVHQVMVRLRNEGSTGFRATNLIAIEVVSLIWEGADIRKFVVRVDSVVE